MKIIEFIGCEGVGKSTLHEAFNNNHSTLSKRYLTSDKTAKQKIAKYIIKTNNPYLNYAFIPNIEIPFVTNFIITKSLRHEYIKELLKSKRDWEEFIQTLFIIHNHSNSTLKLLYSYKWLLSRMEKQQLYENHLRDHILILNSGLFHKICNILVLLNKENIDDFAKETFSRVPIIPYGIIYLNASADVIYERTCKREEAKTKWQQDFRDFHKDSVRDKILIESKIISNGIEIMTKRGVKIAEIDASEDIDQQLNKLLLFLDQLEK